MTAAVPDLREQLARALWADMMDPPGRDWLDDEEKAHALAIGDRLLPVVTAHVAAERERAVAGVVGAVRNVLAEYRPQLDRRHGPDLPVDLWDDIRAALPAQPAADQAQETDR